MFFFLNIETKVLRNVHKSYELSINYTEMKVVFGLFGVNLRKICNLPKILNHFYQKTRAPFKNPYTSKS